MRIEEFSGKSVADATSQGLAKMNLTESQAIITVLDEGGFLRKARVSIAEKETEGTRALHFIEGLLEKMNVKSVLEMEETVDKCLINIVSVESGTLIGHRGDVLDAIQYLASIAANEDNDTFKRVVVDCENYRAKRVDTLENLAKKMADKAVTKGMRLKLEPMNPFERRIIHSTLASDDRVTTESVGEEPFRQLQIVPKNLKRAPYGERRGGDNNRRFGDRKPYNREDRGERRNFGDRDRNGGGRRDSSSRPSKAASIANGFSSYGYLGKSESTSDDKTEE